MYLTQKIRIFPTEEQKELLWILSEKCRLVYNFALKERLERFETFVYLKSFFNFIDSIYTPEIPLVTFYDQYKRLRELRNDKYPEYRWVLERVLSMILKKLDANFKSFYSLRKKWNDKPQFDAITRKPANRPNQPKYLGKNYFTNLCYNRDGFKLVENTISLSHKHSSQTRLSFEIPYNLIPKTKIKQIELFKDDKKDKWFVAITYEYKETGYKDNGLYQAIDLGIDNIVTAVNLKGKSVQFKNKRFDKYWEPKIQETQSKRDHCKHPTKEKPFLKMSKKYRWYNDKLIKIKRKQTNQTKYFQHFISKNIVENTKANTIIIGDLNIKQMASRKKGTGNSKNTKSNKSLNRSIHNSGTLGRFVQFLTYKAEKIGKRVIKIDERHTSQTCCACGTRKKIALFERTYQCNCGNRIDRDLNSAINIMNKFLSSKRKYKFLLQEPSLAEESFLQKDFLRSGLLAYSNYS